MTKIGLFTGSFDPLTNGHLDIIRRASQLFETLYVGLFYNKDKAGFFSLEERRQMLTDALSDLSNVTVIFSQGSLAVDVAQQLEVDCLVRGLRDANDLDYEADLAFYNNYLAEELETIYLLTDLKWRHLSSSRIRELIYFKADISEFVPPSVTALVKEKCNDFRNI